MSRAPTPRSPARLAIDALALALLVGAGAALFSAAAHAQGAPVAPDSSAAPELPRDTSSAAPTVVQAPAPAAKVAAVEVTGRVRVDSLRIVRTFGIDVGSPYDERAVQQGLRRLWGTNLFDDVDVSRHTEDDGVHLLVHVAERPKIASIAFEGAKKLKEEDLTKHLGLQAGDAWKPQLLEAARDSLEHQYRLEGYREATVTASADSGVGGMRLTFSIREGEKAHISGYRFEGNRTFTAKDLGGQLASGKRGFPFKSGTVKEEKLAEDLVKLRKYYRERGYRDVHVERLPFIPDSTNKKGLLLGYKVDEGAFYRMGEVRWQGNDVVKTQALLALPQPAEGMPYNGTRIDDATSGAYALYAEEGFLYVGIEPTEIVRDSNVVDVAFQVSENSPSHVRQVKITGNTYTKENVIRREIELHEGDLFRRSRLMNTQQAVFRLGFFQDVGIEFQPAESTDVDVELKIKEKQTGTAQAGAGYSSDGGLTGFLNLGHNNLFGNGQSVNIQLERGGQRRNLDLSFTDPWFHDTPLSVGGNAYISKRTVGTTDAFTDYEESRRGFSLQVGRPIPNLRYTRGSLRYTLEGVNFAVKSLSVSPQLLALATAGEQVTSSIEAGLSRNSTNNPFYPTKGQRGTFTSRFAGGPLGGDYDFNKTRLDTRWYRKSFKRNMAHMFRLRAGGVGAYSEGDSVPVYERFRLGGVTVDGLRGYDDYSIVPKENDTFSRFAPGSSVVVGSFPRTTVPYPGGRFMYIVTLEEQFPIVNPAHGVIFFDAGNTWNRFGDIQPFDLKKSAGIGVRVEIPILGNVGFDYGYGFDKRFPGWQGHFLLGASLF